MAYDTWDWDPTTGSGRETGFLANPVDPLLSQGSESGAFSTEPLYTSGFWLVELKFGALRPWNYIWLVNWKYTHRGIPFYWRWPFEMAGAPDEIEFADPGGLSPWSSEVEVLAGYGPTFLMLWVDDDFPVSRVPNVQNNYWEAARAVTLRQVL